MKTLAALTLALILTTLAVAAQDQPYPTHTVRMLAPAAPGGNPDVLARLLADKFTAMFGKPFVVENVPGARPCFLAIPARWRSARRSVPMSATIRSRI